jgi:osmoprotectant transport system substrate-binding protein
VLLAVLAAIGLVAAGCGDSDDDGATATTIAPGTSAAPETTAGGAETTAAPETTAGGTGTTAAAGGETGVFEFRPLDVGGALTKEALSAGDIDVALLFTSDADIAVNDWVLLEDDQGLQQIENVTPAIRTEVVTPEIEAVLNAVSAPLTTAELTELNRQVTQDLLEPADVAGTWLEAQGLVPWSGDPVEGSLTVGSTNFFEQEIVAEMYSQALESAGASIDRQFQLGAREIVAPALESGDIDLTPEYLGSYTLFVDGTATVPPDPQAAAEQLRELLADRGVTVLEPAPAEDRNGLVVTRETADQFGLVTTTDLASVPEVLVLGGPPECPERDFCMIGLTEVYGLTFRQ